MRTGFVYAVRTTLKTPPDRKYVLCVSEERNLCVWFNTEARFHGIGQININAGDHDYIVRNCYLDCSRLVMHPDNEIDDDINLPEPRRISSTLARRLHIILSANPPSKLTELQHEQIMNCLSAIFNVEN